MKNNYLEELGIKLKKRESLGSMNAKDTKKLKKQRRKYGFDSRECWNLDYISAVWLCTHLMMYLEDTKKIIDLTYYKYNIPVLIKTDKTSFREMEKNWYEEVMEEHTQEECIKLCIKYLKYYIKSTATVNTGDLERVAEKEGKGLEKLQCAFRIYSIIINQMNW